ncbi:hypothetical protein L210DRAFT_3499666 [Boletus edulis BED1]|uniref:G domain-containing protein n=1 Tax=Boletus edulis BED1 TaxID=1328754 RepID=A0AAD4C9J7_BOLED|nr:hypothetical protein L210DRAFT_3499666 [Boletus edulis BED1]
MSTPSTSPPSFIHVTESPKRLTWGELRIGPRRHKLISDEDGTLRQEFPDVVELSPEVQITLRYKRPWSLGTKNKKINIQDLFANSTSAPTQGDFFVDFIDGLCRNFRADVSVAQGSIRVTFSRLAAETAFFTPPTPETEPPTIGTLQAETQVILEICPKFRILVIGKSGVGKSSLINVAFGINKAASLSYAFHQCAANLKRGEANIDDGLESPSNERFILHDPLASSRVIRQAGALGDQLHAVWFCVQTPRAGGRLLEVAAEDFFRSKKGTLGTSPIVPLIVVYTMVDSFVDELTLQSLSSHSELDEESLTKDARANAESSIKGRHDEITRLADEPIPYAVVSTKERYKDTLDKLVELTYDKVKTRDTPGARTTSVVTLMAQRISPHLKIQGSIDIGRRRYWKALSTSPYFNGHTMGDCLSVIHADIVDVWNFNDPAGHLHDSKFRELVVKMVQEMETRSASNLDGTSILGSVLSSGSLAAAAPQLMVAVSNPAAPIVLPIIAGVAIAVWVYGVYQNVKNVQQKSMAFIVDLTHIMETLFILTCRDHNKLTRRAVKLAYTTYYESVVMKQAHTDILGYSDGVGRGGALEMIECLIKPERSGDMNMKKYFAEIRKWDIQGLDLDHEEDW